MDIIDCILLADCDIPRIPRDLLGTNNAYAQKHPIFDR